MPTRVQALFLLFGWRPLGELFNFVVQLLSVSPHLRCFLLSPLEPSLELRFLFFGEKPRLFLDIIVPGLNCLKQLCAQCVEFVADLNIIIASPLLVHQLGDASCEFFVSLELLFQPTF